MYFDYMITGPLSAALSIIAENSQHASSLRSLRSHFAMPALYAAERRDRNLSGKLLMHAAAALNS